MRCARDTGPTLFDDPAEVQAVVKPTPLPQPSKIPIGTTVWGWTNNAWHEGVVEPLCLHKPAPHMVRVTYPALAQFSAVATGWTRPRDPAKNGADKPKGRP